jgi:putative methyltransferase (TIGR04325 family)
VRAGAIGGPVIHRRPGHRTTRRRPSRFGVLPYLDVPFDELLRRLPSPPRHLVLNKVATRLGPTFVTLENFGCAEVPYQIRDYTQFLSSLDALGYDVVDEWRIPELSHVIPTHRSLGASVGIGLYARRRDDCGSG